jgi:hypothetical protein
MQASAYSDPGRVCLRLARFPEAAVWLEKGGRCWREMKLAKAFDARRKSEVAALDFDFGGGG